MGKNLMTSTGLPDGETEYTVSDLLAALSPQQNEKLINFARLRLDRVTRLSSSKEYLATLEPEELVSRTIAKVLIGEKDAKVGRRLSAKNRANTESFLRALQGVLNSDLANLVRCAEACYPHVRLDEGIEEGSCGLLDLDSPAVLTARRDLQQVVFAKLYQRTADAPELWPIIRAVEQGFLHDACLAKDEPNRGLVYRVRLLVREVLRELAQEFGGPEATGKEMFL